MMFVSGATSDPPLQTVAVTEDIVRAQVVELINRATTLARRRGARSISVEDIIFLIRHNSAKVNRLSTYLAWKDVRKNARDQDSGASGPGEGGDLIDDPAAALGGSDKKSQKRKRIGLPWKPQNMFAIPMTAVNLGASSLPQTTSAVSNSGGVDTDVADVADVADAPDVDAVENESDDEDSEATQILNERLRNADLRTRNMTREEYVHWSECRQASFTFRKAKRFRDWSGLSAITDSRLQDDIMDVLGFLTFEIVANLTSSAQKVKAKWEARRKQQDEPDKPLAGHLFKRRDVQETPLLPEHIRAAYAQFEMATPKAKALRNWQGGRVRYMSKII